MQEVEIRQQILDSLIEIRNKKENCVIPIEKKELVFESSKYSSTKENIWHVLINGIKIKKTSEFTFMYNCLRCEKQNVCASTQFLRKIRQCKGGCFQCNNVDLNLRDRTVKSDDKPVKVVKTYREIYESSLAEFELYPDQYKNSYLLSHLSIEDYKRMSANIISFGNGKYTDFENYEYWPIYKVNNQMKFSHMFYDTKNDSIFKANQPVLKCDNCEGTWRCKTLEKYKNCHKILCHNCTLCNRTFKIRPMKNINNELLMYQSKLELKFIEWCASKNIIVRNGPTIGFEFKNKNRTYRVDFQIGDYLIEIKDFHIWHKNQVDSGLWDKKVDAVEKYIISKGLKKYYFITPNNWNQMLGELEKNIIKKA